MPAIAQDHPNLEFRKLAARLAQQRLDAAEEKPELQQQALTMLDEFALRALNSPTTFNLEGVNQQLATWVTQKPPVGEGYQLLPLVPVGRAAGELWALVVNFGLSGPSAVRIYARSGGVYKLAGRIDRFTHQDFFDEYLELLPISSDGAFVTVTGRTDELQTGGFTAWRYDGREVTPLWASDLLQQSKYEFVDGEFRLTFCAETDEDKPRVCQKMLRETYRWTAGQWRRTSQSDAPLPKTQPSDDTEECGEPLLPYVLPRLRPIPAAAVAASPAGYHLTTATASHPAFS
jgi:hypothetical protein